jgi:TPP-dependent pyruvate/acetoin dehydrogenase alpha subunit
MDVKLEPKELRRMYRDMLRIRLFEERTAELESQPDKSRVKTTIHAHLYIGEEAVAVGACTALREDDYITSTHRGHGHCIAKGTPLKHMMAELMGRTTGIPIAVGAGLSIKLRGTDQVCVCFFGDGATNQGTFHESLNLASIWTLPVVFVCENNKYAMSTPSSYAIPLDDIAQRAVAYNIPGVSVDGMTVTGVHAAVREAVARARSGGGPTFIVCDTYRFRGHSGPYETDLFGRRYRTSDEVKQWRARDPISTFRTALLQTGAASEVELGQIEQSVQREIDDALQFAYASPDPEPATALDGLFAE